MDIIALLKLSFSAGAVEFEEIFGKFLINELIYAFHRIKNQVLFLKYRDHSTLTTEGLCHLTNVSSLMRILLKENFNNFLISSVSVYFEHQTFLIFGFKHRPCENNNPTVFNDPIRYGAKIFLHSGLYVYISRPFQKKFFSRVRGSAA